jgi:hypothetical protein
MKWRLVTTKAEPAPVPRSEVQTHEKESRSNPEAELEVPAQECQQPSEVVGILEEGVIMEVCLTLVECP